MCVYLIFIISKQIFLFYWCLLQNHFTFITLFRVCFHLISVMPAHSTWSRSCFSNNHFNRFLTLFIFFYSFFFKYIKIIYYLSVSSFSILLHFKMSWFFFLVVEAFHVQFSLYQYIIRAHVIQCKQLKTLFC